MPLHNSQFAKHSSQTQNETLHLFSSLCNRSKKDCNISFSMSFGMQPTHRAIVLICGSMNKKNQSLDEQAFRNPSKKKVLQLFCELSMVDLYLCLSCVRWFCVSICELRFVICELNKGILKNAFGTVTKISFFET